MYILFIYMCVCIYVCVFVCVCIYIFHISLFPQVLQKRQGIRMALRARFN